MNIKNCTIHGKGITINGKVVGKEKPKGEPKKIDELKVEDANLVNKIEIESDTTDVYVLASNGPKIKAHLRGNVHLDGDLDFDVRCEGSTLKIKVDFTGICYIGNVTLDVTVPAKMFNRLSIETASADVVVNEDVCVEQLHVETASGDVKTDSFFANANIKTMSGDVELNTFAKQDIKVKIKTMSGDVLAKFGNVREMVLCDNTMRGQRRNTHEGGYGHLADVDIATMSGDINVSNLMG